MYFCQNGQIRRTVALGEGRLDLGNDILLSEQMFFGMSRNAAGECCVPTHKNVCKRNQREDGRQSPKFSKQVTV